MLSAAIVSDSSPAAPIVCLTIRLHFLCSGAFIGVLTIAPVIAYAIEGWQSVCTRNLFEKVKDGRYDSRKTINRTAYVCLPLEMSMMAQTEMSKTRELILFNVHVSRVASW